MQKYARFMSVMISLFLLSIGSNARAQQEFYSVDKNSVRMVGLSEIHHTIILSNLMLDPVSYEQFGERSGDIYSSFHANSPTHASQAADDFIVPDGGWSVTGGYVLQQNTPEGEETITSIDVFFYNDEAGKPGRTTPCIYPMHPVASVGPNRNLTIELTNPCVLNAGTYWLSVIANMSSGYTWFWDTTATTFGAPPYWRNYGAGFRICLDWIIINSCGKYDGVGGMLFNIHGESLTSASMPAVTPVFTQPQTQLLPLPALIVRLLKVLLFLKLSVS